MREPDVRTRGAECPPQGRAGLDDPDGGNGGSGGEISTTAGADVRVTCGSTVPDPRAVGVSRLRAIAVADCDRIPLSWRSSCAKARLARGRSGRIDRAA